MKKIIFLYAYAYHCIAMCNFHQLLGFKQVILMCMCIQMILVQNEIMIHWPHFIHSLWIPQLTAWLVLKLRTVYFFSGGLATHWCSCWFVFYHLLKYKNLSLYAKSSCWFVFYHLLKYKNLSLYAKSQHAWAFKCKHENGKGPKRTVANKKK